jgi:hypothetical protein
MANPVAVRVLRDALATSNVRWTLNPLLHDEDIIPEHALGALVAGHPTVDKLPRTDIRPFLSLPTANPFLRYRRANRGFLNPTILHPILSTTVAGPGAGAPASVDWRNRFGWPWLTNIKDQDPCESCW